MRIGRSLVSYGLAAQCLMYAEVGASEQARATPRAHARAGAQSTHVHVLVAAAAAAAAAAASPTWAVAPGGVDRCAAEHKTGGKGQRAAFPAGTS